MPRIVIAIGGNAISSSSSLSSFSSDSTKMGETIKTIAKLYSNGNNVVVTHGNGPQVGSELERNELASRRIPELPLFYLTAETQSVMGSTIEMALRSMLPRSKGSKVCTLISHVLVDATAKNPGKPTKPIGPFMRKAELKFELKQDSFKYFKKGNKYRRLASSPQPLEVLESSVIKLLSKDNLVICGGGGGIPLVGKANSYVGIDAVIDKDLTTALIAIEIRAQKMVILTDTDYLYPDATAKGMAIKEINLKAAKMLVNRLEEGTIKPKLKACINFLEHGGKEAYIGNVYRLGQIMSRESGTRIKQ